MKFSIYLNRRVFVILPSIVSTLGKRELCFSLVCGMCTVCLCLVAPPLGGTGRLCSVIVAFP